MTTRSIGLCPVHHHPLVGLHERRRIITPLLNLLFRVRNRLLALLYIKPSPPFLIILPLTLVPQNALALHTWLKRSSQGRSLCPCPSSRHSIPEPEADPPPLHHRSVDSDSDEPTRLLQEPHLQHRPFQVMSLLPRSFLWILRNPY